MTLEGMDFYGFVYPATAQSYAAEIPAIVLVDILPSFRGRPGENIVSHSRSRRIVRRVRPAPAPHSRRLPICQSLIAAL